MFFFALSKILSKKNFLSFYIITQGDICMQIQPTNSNANFKGLHRLECHSFVKGITEHCYTKRHYYPFMDESQDKVNKVIDYFTFTTSYSPDQTGGFFWIDHNKVKLEKRLPITRNHWKKYLKERGVKQTSLVRKVEDILRCYHLEHYIIAKSK